MAIDYCVALACEPKLQFGQGDAARGATEILEALKSQNRAAAFRAMAQKAGKDPATTLMTLRVHDQDGNPVEKQTTLAELEEHARGLDEKAGYCRVCRANVLGQAYGCFGAINYPISGPGENWLISRLQPLGTIGAQICLDYMKEFKIDGESIANLRKGGFFQSKSAPEKVLKKALFSKVSVTSDQLLQTILHVGNPLQPSHCFGILVWLGAIRVGDKVPATVNEQAVLFSMATPQQKEQQTRLEIGDQSPDPGVQSFQTLVKALYICWVLDVPLWISP